MFLPPLIRVSFYTAVHSLVLSKKVHFSKSPSGTKRQEGRKWVLCWDKNPMQHSNCSSNPSCPIPVDSPVAHYYSENQIQTHVSQQCRRLPQFVLGIPLGCHFQQQLSLSPWSSHPGPLPPPLWLLLLPTPLPTFLDKSSSFLPFHVQPTCSLLKDVFPNHFGKVVPSSQPFQFLPSSINHYKKLFKMIYLLFGHLSTAWECELQESRERISIIVDSIVLTTGLPWWLSGKESNCQCRICGRLGFNPWVRKIPWKRAWQSTPVFLPGKSHGQRSLAG